MVFYILYSLGYNSKYIYIYLTLSLNVCPKIVIFFSNLNKYNNYCLKFVICCINAITIYFIVKCLQVKGILHI